MKAAMLLTTDLGPALVLAKRLREGLPQAKWTAYVRDEDRERLLPALVGCVIRSDKPRGSKIAFLRALRAERFDVMFVAWHGGERSCPLRGAALLAGAKDLVSIDERGRSRSVQWWAPWTWSEHLVRRMSQLRVLRVMRFCASMYRVTIGRAIHAVLLLPEVARQRRMVRPSR